MVYHEEPVTCHGWVVFLDIYGFSFMIESNEASEIHRKLSLCHSDINNLLKTTTYQYKTYFFSDSIFVVFPLINQADNQYHKDKEEIMKHCLNKAQDIMGICVKHDFPVRGGMAFGEIRYSDNLLIGRAVVKAHTYETMIEVPLLVLPYNELSGTSFMKAHSLKDIIILKDNSPIFAKLFFPFPKDEFLQLVEDKFQKYCLNGPQAPAKAWYNAKKYIESLEREIS